MKLLFTKSIPPNPAPSKIIPIISETLYIYLIGFQLVGFQPAIGKVSDIGFNGFVRCFACLSHWFYPTYEMCKQPL